MPEIRQFILMRTTGGCFAISGGSSASLGKSLLEAGDTTKAVEAVTRGLEIVPASKLPHDYFSMAPAEVLIKAGKKEEGEKIFNSIIEYADDHLDYIVKRKEH